MKKHEKFFKAQITVCFSLSDTELKVQEQIEDKIKSVLDRTLAESFLREVYEEIYVDDVLEPYDDNYPEFEALYKNDNGWMPLEVIYDIDFSPS